MRELYKKKERKEKPATFSSLCLPACRCNWQGSILFSRGLCSPAIKGALLILLSPRCSENIFNSSLLYASLRRRLIIHFKTQQLLSLPPHPILIHKRRVSYSNLKPSSAAAQYSPELQGLLLVPSLHGGLAQGVSHDMKTHVLRLHFVQSKLIVPHVLLWTLNQQSWARQRPS